MKKSDSRLGTIEAVKKIGISINRLRYWELRGIIKPEFIQCSTRKFRSYSEKDIKRAISIKRLVDVEKYTLEGAVKKLEEEKQ